MTVGWGSRGERDMRVAMGESEQQREQEQLLDQHLEMDQKMVELGNRLQSLLP